jgi:hypothetical protein
MSASPASGRCSQIAPLLVFYSCDELTSQERARVQAHLAVCPGCATQLAQETALLEAIGDVPQTAQLLGRDDILLSQCRSELAESLDDMASPAPAIVQRWQPFGWVHRAFALHPAWSGAALLIIGAALGTQVLQWLPAGNSANSGTAVNVLAAPRVTDEQLAKMAVAGIGPSTSPDAAPGTFQVQLRAEQPMVISGNVDDADMRRVMTYVVENGGRFDAGLRLDCLDALKARTSDVQVRRALIAAARHDENAAVRMKALESLRDAAEDAGVRGALLDALEHDANPGVRVEAVNLLVRSLESAPPAPGETAGNEPKGPTEESGALTRVMRTLDELQRRDPNRYVRLRSAAALRQLAPHEIQ